MCSFLRLLAATTICASLALIGVRTLRPPALPTACIQLLSPTTATVLTLDADTGAFLPDALGYLASLPPPALPPSSPLLDSLMAIAGKHLSWSPALQKALILSESDTAFTLRWATTTAATTVDFPKHHAPNEALVAYWLNDDLALVNHYFGESQTTWLLNTSSARLLELFTIPNDTFYTTWVDTNYFAFLTRTDVSLYHLRDGTPLFTDIQLNPEGYVFFVTPDEYAMLMYRDGLAGLGAPQLHLVTAHSRQIVSTINRLTAPAWSPDGERFVFAGLDHMSVGWEVTLMSRDGDLLRRFTLPAATSLVPYRYVRWTDCG